MGLEFETMCREYLWNHILDLKDELFLSDVGKWRGHDNIAKAPADIDVVGIDSTEKKAVLGECKFRNEKTGLKELLTLKNRSRLIRPYQTVKYFLFSLSGFQDTLKNVDKDTVLVSLKEMYDA